ncbi:MAG TPA: TlpA disulfide reductase family protein [bacterium]|nr:TlpA disulfide reductase family protein [bacterium]
MKKIIPFLTVFFLFSACTGKKDVQPEKKETPEIKKAETVEENHAEISSGNFEKGQTIHHISLPSVKTGEIIKFETFKGKRILFDFWSSWCEPCIAMFPDINKLKTELEDKKGNLKILSISVDPMKGNVLKIMEQKKVLFEVLQAPESLANSGILMPFAAVADENGKIIRTVSGKHTYEEFLKLIEE